MRETLSSTSTLNPSLRSAVSGRHNKGGKIQLVFLNGQRDESLIPPFLDGGTFYQIRGSLPSDFCTDEGFLALVKHAFPRLFLDGQGRGKIFSACLVIASNIRRGSQPYSS